MRTTVIIKDGVTFKKILYAMKEIGKVVNMDFTEN